MNDYQIGRDVEALAQRLAAIENQLRAEDDCGCTDEEGVSIRADVVKEQDADPNKDGLEALASRTFRWSNANHLGRCELRGGYTLTIFSDGRYRAIGTRKCNAGGINSCKNFDVTVELYRGACNDNPPAIARFNVRTGLMGPGSEGAFTTDGRDEIIQRLFSEIRCAAMWVSRCRTGV